MADRILIPDVIDEFLLYLESVKGYSKNTVISYKNDLEKFKFYSGTEKYIDELSFNDIRYAIAGLSERGEKSTTINRYISAVKSAVSVVGEDGVIIVDSFSHAWNNEGGVLDIKSEIAKTRPGKNDYTAWDEAGKYQNNLVNTILAVNAHTIVTMRAKMAYAMETNEKGKTVPVKIGLAPVQRDDTEYEFDIAMNIGRDHIAVTSKDTTFLDGFASVITPELGKELKDWLDKGVNPERCSDCGKVIRPTDTRTVAQIVEGSQKCYGRKLCINCVSKIVRQQKQEAKANENKG